MAEFTVQGEEMIDRVAEETESGVQISLPESWDGEHVKVIRTRRDSPSASRPNNETVAGTVADSTVIDTPNEPSDDPTSDDTSMNALNDQNPARTPERVVKNTIKELNTGDGAPISDIIREVQKENVTQETCMNVIDELRRTGEVYEPTDNRLKRT